MNRQRLDFLVRVWKRQIVLREVIFALAAACFVVALVVWRPQTFRWQWPWAILVGTLAARLAVRRPWKLDAAQISRHLNRTCPELEESAALFLRPPQHLTLLERLQLSRINRAVFARAAGMDAPGSSPGLPPHDFLRAACRCWLAAASLVVLTALYLVQHPAKAVPSFQQVRSEPRTNAPGIPARSVPPRIAGNTFTITPPTYTGRPPRLAEGLAVEVEEGSNVAWSIVLDQPISKARLVAGSTTVSLDQSSDRRWRGSAAAPEAALFALTGTLPDGTAWNPPELFSVKVIKDQPPAVRLIQPAQARTEIVPPAPGPVTVEAIIGDDYAVADAHLVATVAKGSGEAVKFREQRIAFDTDNPAGSPLIHHYAKSLDFAALGLEPGDELYFFVEASDNCQPTPNHTRSETRFVLLRGPEEKPTTTGRGVAGVNLIPQYFRSERQLIIDTEKLLADQPTLADAEFRARANDLGADQALLRLRYGRFLGEDQEESPLTDHLETNLDPLQAAPRTTAPGPHAAASIAQRFRQEHLAQDREGGGEDATLHPPPGGAPLTAAQVRQPFVDTHDIRDKNTFFDSATKGTMRDALAAMWEAEGFLRTARPPEALAPERRALDILKDLQQSARAYVQHVGFEAPPLKVAERRLKGEAADVPSRTLPENRLSPADPAVANARAALAALSQTGTIPVEQLGRVEPALLAAATRQPDDFLPGLQALRHWRATGEADPSQERSALQRALLRLLPPADALPARQDEPAPALAGRYFQILRGTEVPP